MKLIRCLNCNKVLGEVEGKAKIKCKMAGCHCMNVIDTDAGTHFEEAKWSNPDGIQGAKWIIGSCPDTIKTRDELTNEEKMKLANEALQEYVFKPNN